MTDTEIDFGGFDAQDEGTLAIRHPATDQPTSWLWTFYGPGHPITVELAARASKEALHELREHRQAQLNGKKIKLDEESIDEIKSKNVATVVARLKEFTPVTINGEKIEFSPQKATELLLDRRKGWLWNQVSDYLRAEENFMRPSAKS